jgi:hypothetical protein
METPSGSRPCGNYGPEIEVLEYVARATLVSSGVVPNQMTK